MRKCSQIITNKLTCPPHLKTDHVKYRTNIIWSLMHEFGHVLGVLHTDVLDRSLIMYPHQRLLVPRLGEDDIKAVQSLYGQLLLINL